MDEALKRFSQESAILLRQARSYQDDPTETRIQLAVAQAKTVRREATVLLKLLAAERDAINDTPTAEEAQGNEYREQDQ